MRTFLLLALILADLVGCASTSAPYGNFIQNTAVTNDKKMADDAVKKLVALYPPANSRFKLQHATPDAFGTSLVEAMRAKGYALLEFGPELAVPQQATPDANRTAQTSAGLSLSYILDQTKGSDLYRVSLIINNQSLSRVYQIKDGKIYPAGYWVRKE